MNTQEAIILQKMVEHLNVIRQYGSILHKRTYDDVFRIDEFDRMFEVDDLRKVILEVLEKESPKVTLPVSDPTFHLLSID